MTKNPIQKSCVAIVGYPGCGKTVLLSTLCGEYYPLNDSTRRFNENYELLKKGKIPQRTEVLTKANMLAWEVPDHKCNRIIVSRDFAGESWDSFVATYCGYGAPIPKCDDNEIANFLSQAEAIAVCVDLKALIDEKDRKQTYLVYAISEFMKRIKLNPKRLAVVFTKYDLVEDFVTESRGLENVLSGRFHLGLYEQLKNNFFPVSSIQTKYSHKEQKMIVKKDFVSIGQEDLKNWIFWLQDCERGSWIIRSLKALIGQSPKRPEKIEYINSREVK